MVRESYSYGNKYLIAIFQVDADLCSCCIPEIRDLQDLWSYWKGNIWALRIIVANPPYEEVVSWVPSNYIKIQSQNLDMPD